MHKLVEVPLERGEARRLDTIGADEPRLEALPNLLRRLLRGDLHEDVLGQRLQ